MGEFIIHYLAKNQTLVSQKMNDHLPSRALFSKPAVVSTL
jgi:hypothetical protein